MRDRHAMPSKRIFLDDRRFLEVPIAHPPSSIPERAWNRLTAINDYIIDRVAYDDARAASTITTGVQSPDETLLKRRGVCMDFAALFEHLASKEGFEVRSVRSARLNHAWNTVQIGGQWWIVDVTWNSGARLENGRHLPSSVTNDPDFRKRYLLTTVTQERELAARGLLASTHDTPDAADVEYARTLEATGLVERVEALIAERAAAIASHREVVQEHSDLLTEARAVQDELNDPKATARRALNTAKQRVIRERLDDAATRAEQFRSTSSDLGDTIEVLVDRLRRLSATHPLAIRFEYASGR